MLPNCYRPTAEIACASNCGDHRHGRCGNVSAPTIAEITCTDQCGNDMHEISQPGIRSAKTVGIFPQSAEIANTVKTESGSEATQREAKGQQDQERGPLGHFYHNQLKLQSDERGAVGLKIYLCLVSSLRVRW